MFKRFKYKWFHRPEWARLRHDRNGEVLKSFMLGDRPMIKVRIPRPGKYGESIVTKNLPFADVLFVTRYPSRFERLLGIRRTKTFSIQLKK